MTSGTWNHGRWWLLAGGSVLLCLMCLGSWIHQSRSWWQETSFSQRLTQPQQELERQLKELGQLNRQRLSLFSRSASAQHQVQGLFDLADSLDLSLDNFVAKADKRQGRLERQQIRLECSGTFPAALRYLHGLEETGTFHVKEVFLIRLNNNVTISVDGYLLRTLD